MKKTVFFLTLFFPVFLLAGYCQALDSFDLSGPQSPAPYGIFSTISADSPDKGRSAVAFTFEQSGNPDFQRFSSQLAVGVTRKVEIGMNVSYVEGDSSGIEDIALTLKHRFFEEGMYGPSVAYLLTTSISSSSEALSTDGRVGMGLVASKRVGPLRGHINFIYSKPWDSTFEDELRFAAGMEFAAAHDFSILAEMYARKSHFSKKVDQQEARLGYRFFYKEEVFSTIGIGLGIKDNEPEYRIMLSMSLIFPRKVKAIERSFEAGE